MLRRVDARIWSFVGYTALSSVYFGWRLLPHPGRMLVGTSVQQDPDIFVWSFAWWPHAILNGIDPFFSHAVYAPTGVNLAWVTSVPGLAIAFTPVTLLFGPTVAYNLAALLLPALSAWTAFLLCRYLTKSLWASLFGGYIYGFSSYMLAQEFSGHEHLTSAFIPPLVALAVLRHLNGEVDRRGLVWRLSLAIAFQASLSTEVAVTLTLALGIGLLLGYAVSPPTRPRLRSSLPPILAGYLGAGVLAAPLVYYGLTDIPTATLGGAGAFSADPLNLIVPTHVTALGGSTFASFVSHFSGNDAERDSYLGIPILLIVALFLLRRPWSTGTRFAVAAFTTATLASLGIAFTIDGHGYFWLPWSLMANLTGFKNVIPSRLALYATLAAAVLVAMWIATTRGRIFKRPYVLPVLAVAALMPPFWTSDFVQHPARLAFFTTGAYKRCVPQGETLMIFPFAYLGRSLLWQAETGFWFQMDEGALGPRNLPESFAGDGTVGALLFYFSNPSGRPSMADLLGLAARRHVDRIVSVTNTGDVYPSPTQMRAFGRPSNVDDVVVSPGCGLPSLRARG